MGATSPEIDLTSTVEEVVELIVVPHLDTVVCCDGAMPIEDSGTCAERRCFRRAR